MILLLISFFIVAFGQSAWIAALGPLASAFGYALFWHSCLKMERRFWIASAWFTTVQLVQISWMSETTYMGPLILVVYLCLSIAMGLQFGLLSWMIQLPLRIPALIGIASFWVLCEWVRLFFLTGFTWSFAGLALASSLDAIQWAALFGMYGLSFWVILVNLAALRAWDQKRVGAVALWVILALLPYGCGRAVRHGQSVEQKQVLSVLLVQTDLRPEEKVYLPQYKEAFIPPLYQWERIIEMVHRMGEEPLDLIVLPEAAVAYGAFYPQFSSSHIETLWRHYFKEGDFSDAPSRVAHAFIAQRLADRYGADLIAGFEDEMEGGRTNAAFHFAPGKARPERYEKRRLVPIGEYIPFSRWDLLRQFLTHEFGVVDSFQEGKAPKVFPTRIPAGISICCEETYSDLVRETKQLGAELLVSISNDVWFPKSKLPEQHLDICRVRSVENGLFSFRSCNTGASAIIDPYGEVIHRISGKEGALRVSLPIFVKETLYSKIGDSAVVWFSALTFAGFLLLQKVRLG